MQYVCFTQGSWQRPCIVVTARPPRAISRSTLNCTSENVNGPMNTFCRAALPDALQKGALALNLSFTGTETGTVLSACIISASHPSASCCSLTASERPARALGTSPSTCVWQAAAVRQFASDYFPFSQGEFKLGRKRSARKREASVGR